MKAESQDQTGVMKPFFPIVKEQVIEITKQPLRPYSKVIVHPQPDRREKVPPLIPPVPPETPKQKPIIVVDSSNITSNESKKASKPPIP